MSPVPATVRRRTVLVNAKLQLGTAAALAAVLLAGGILFGAAFHREGRDALVTASFRGHFFFRTPYDVLGDLVVRHLLFLFALVTAAGCALLLLLLRWIDAGLAGIADAFRVSAEGDLSSPTRVRGPQGIATFGAQIDEVRGQVLERIGEIRREIGVLRSEPLPQEEFLRRWEGLKEKIRGFAP